MRKMKINVKLRENKWKIIIQPAHGRNSGNVGKRNKGEGEEEYLEDIDRSIDRRLQSENRKQRRTNRGRKEKRRDKIINKEGRMIKMIKDKR